MNAELPLFRDLLSLANSRITTTRAERLWNTAGGWHDLLFHRELENRLALEPREKRVLNIFREVGSRILRGEIVEPPIHLDSSRAVYQAMKGHWALPEERVWCLSLNSQNRLLQLSEVFRGGQSLVHASPREILRTALIADATKFILVHNHPSGEAKPSEADARFTVQLAWGADQIGLPLVDHLILGRASYFSFADVKLL